jgi:glycerol-3-phosphate cytidylyltransferase
MSKYKIGYTTGVFDLFHIGHLNILRRSKELCDYLIVGVSSDAVVEEYKHKKPVIRYEERAAIVEAIRYVDRVVMQTSMDKMAAWRELRFNVLFHGDDWKNSPLYEKYKQELSAVGVDLVFFEYTRDTSSTSLANKIEKIELIRE